MKTPKTAPAKVAGHRRSALWDTFRRIDFDRLYEGPERIAHATLHDGRVAVTVPKSSKGAPTDLTEVDGLLDYASEGEDSITMYVSHLDMERGWERLAGDLTAPPEDRKVAAQFCKGMYRPATHCDPDTAARALRAAIREGEE